MIDLSPLRLVDASPSLIEFGGVITPALGAVVQRVDRAGDRWSLDFATPRVRMEPEGRRWSAMLVRAKKTRARMPVVQKDLSIGAPGQPVMATATLSGRFLPLRGLTPGYAIRAGQWLNYQAGDMVFLDQVADQVIADASGRAVVEIQNLLRHDLAEASAINLAQPVIEGTITGDFQWPVNLDGTTSFEFSVSEDA